MLTVLLQLGAKDDLIACPSETKKANQLVSLDIDRLTYKVFGAPTVSFKCLRMVLKEKFFESIRLGKI